MRTPIFAIGAMACAALANAQSSVTVFGVVDTSVSAVSNRSERVWSTVPTLNSLTQPGVMRTSRTGLNNSAYVPSRLGLRGVEDLGGGLSAGFWLEGALGTDDGSGAAGGALNFQRRSTVSLAGSWGELRLGRDYKPTFWNYSVFDPFLANGAGMQLTYRSALDLESSLVRSSNSVGYFLPPGIGGFYGQAMYGFHEQTKAGEGQQGALNDNCRGGRYVGGRLGYANGPLDVAVAYGEQLNTSSWRLGSDTDASNGNIAGSYDFGAAKLFGNYTRVKVRTSYAAVAPLVNPSTSMRGVMVGVLVPVGVGQIRAAYSRVRVATEQNGPAPLTPAFQNAVPEAGQLSLGYIHNLSKRTSVYGTVAWIRNRNGAAYSAGSGNITAPWVTSSAGVAYLAGRSMGYDLGIRHTF